jgi:hypothetical protein
MAKSNTSMTEKVTGTIGGIGGLNTATAELFNTAFLSELLTTQVMPAVSVVIALSVIVYAVLVLGIVDLDDY